LLDPVPGPLYFHCSREDTTMQVSKNAIIRKGLESMISDGRITRDDALLLMGSKMGEMTDLVTELIAKHNRSNIKVVS